VKNVSPELRRTVPEVSPVQFPANLGVVGIWPPTRISSLLIGEGRLMTEDDGAIRIGSYSRLCCPAPAFPGQPAVGATLLIKSVPYTVIGVLTEKNRFELRTAG